MVSDAVPIRNNLASTNHKSNIRRSLHFLSRDRRGAPRAPENLRLHGAGAKESARDVDSLSIG